MTKEQRIIATGAVCGAIAMAISVFLIYRLLPVPGGADIAGMRLAYALQANLLAVLPLLVMIMWVANGRFMSEAIDPTLGKELKAQVVDGRVIDNTVQQFVLFFVATTALSAHLNADQVRVILAAAIVFVVARLIFWIGYRIHPLYRAPGMAATSYLNVGLIAAAVWNAVARGS